MAQKNITEAIAEKYGVKKDNKRKTINRAIRTLPGGNELLDAIESTNASRNHAQKAGDDMRVRSVDSAIDNLEDIREAMERHILESIAK